MRKRKKWTGETLRLAFSPEAFCDAHDIGRSTFYNEIKIGRLKGRKVNGRTIVTAEDAADWRRNLPLAGNEAA